MNCVTGFELLVQWLVEWHSMYTMYCMCCLCRSSVPRVTRTFRCRSESSVACLVSRLLVRHVRSRSISGRGKSFILSSNNRDLTLGCTHRPVQWVPGALSQGVKWCWCCEVDRSPWLVTDSHSPQDTVSLWHVLLQTCVTFSPLIHLCKKSTPKSLTLSLVINC